MRILKGFLVVIAVYAIGMVTKILWTQSMLSASGQEMNAALIFPIVLFPIFGVITWLIRGGIAHLVAKRAFKGKGEVTELLYGYGVSHFPLIAVHISSLFIFSNIGLFAYLFFMVFAPLLMYTFFVNAVMMFHELSWKQGLLTVIIAEIIIALPSILFLGLSAALGFISGGNEMTAIMGLGSMG